MRCHSCLKHIYQKYDIQFFFFLNKSITFKTNYEIKTVFTTTQSLSFLSQIFKRLQNIQSIQIYNYFKIVKDSSPHIWSYGYCNSTLPGSLTFCYIPDFRQIVVTRELVVGVKYMDSIMKCMALLINATVYEYRLFMNLKYAVKLLTFVNENFCSEMLATRSLVQIDMVKQTMINCEFKIQFLFQLNIVHKFVMQTITSCIMLCV